MSTDARKDTQVSALEAAEAAHDAARAAHSDNLQRETTARAHATDLRQRVTAGKGADVSPSNITEADAAAEHASLAAQGSSKSLAELGKVVQDARANEECDLIVSTLPVLGSQVLSALDAVEAALQSFAEASNNYDVFIEHARLRVNTTGQEFPRVKLSRHSHTTVDNVPLVRCHGASHLARVVLPAMKNIGGPDFAISELKILAEGATPLPTEDS